MLRELGGICGNVFKLDGAVKKTTIKNCYNLGEVSSNTSGTNDANLGGIVGGLLADAEVKYCYNLGPIKKTGGGNHVGGLIGYCSNAAVIGACWNSGNVSSSYYFVGGLCGRIDDASIAYCYINRAAVVQINGIAVTAQIGTDWPKSSSYGRLLGYAKSTNCYSNLGEVNSEEMPTVYDVLNEFGETDSTIWDKTNPNEPKLLWELQQ